MRCDGMGEPWAAAGGVGEEEERLSRFPLDNGKERVLGRARTRFWQGAIAASAQFELYMYIFTRADKRHFRHFSGFGYRAENRAVLTLAATQLPSVRTTISLLSCPMSRNCPTANPLHMQIPEGKRSQPSRFWRLCIHTYAYVSTDRTRYILSLFERMP